MPIQQWSDGILLVELADPPQFSEEMQALDQRLDRDPRPDVVLNFSGVDRISSTNISQLLKLRKRMTETGRRLRLCSMGDAVWGVLMVAGMDKMFEFSPDVPSALASLQLRE